MSNILTSHNRNDFPVGKVALTDFFGNEYCVKDETVAVLFDNEGEVCDLANNIETAVNHVQDGQGTALALKCDYDEDIDDVQGMLDYHREVYSDCFGV